MFPFPDDLLLALGTAFAASALLSFVLVRFTNVNGGRALDSTVGPQKFHNHQVCRIGGLAIIIAVSAALIIEAAWAGGERVTRNGLILLACALPAAVAGFAEDVFKTVRVSVRLGATVLSAWMAYFLLDGVLDRLDIAGLDTLLQYAWFSFFFTAFAVAGIANAINIIDGFNGLAGMVSVLALSAITFVALQAGDVSLAGLCLITAAAIGGFLVWNFPGGRIFLGDGGAYFVGFLIAELSVLLVRRNADVSPWFPFMVVAYPVVETMFSIYRKKALRGHSPGQPDGLHLHMLVFKRIVRWKIGSPNPADRVARNSLTSPFLWCLSLVTMVPGVLFWNSSVVLSFIAAGFVFLYIWLYRRIVTFRVPRWVRLHSQASVPQPVVPDDEEVETPGRPA